jgi:DNA-binding PadR family transcriptional regulator
MTSAVNWALLGLIIERESYAFELATRFRRIYSNVITLSSTSHIYTALGVLQARSLVEQVPGTGPGRQPKPQYRATPSGIQSYGEWLVDYVSEDRRRQVVYALALSSLFGEPGLVLEILARSEKAWLEQDGKTGAFALDRLPAGIDVELISRILDGENELTVAAKRSWIQQVRQELDSRVE